VCGNFPFASPQQDSAMIDPQISGSLTPRKPFVIHCLFGKTERPVGWEGNGDRVTMRLMRHCNGETRSNR
jgi:hypothetical protein